jgi:DNA-binding IclR family transcriptional regulator
LRQLLPIRDQRDVVFVAKAQTHAPMFSSVKVHVGTRLPAHATVHGQVLMGDLTFEELRQLYPAPNARRPPSKNCTKECAKTRRSVMR